jgi:hypothetical protein
MCIQIEISNARVCLCEAELISSNAYESILLSRGHRDRIPDVKCALSMQIPSEKKALRIAQIVRSQNSAVRKPRLSLLFTLLRLPFGLSKNRDRWT